MSENIQTLHKREVGKRLRTLRKQLALSMDEFAKTIESTSATISNIENGRSMPGGEILIRIAEQFSVSIDWILRGKGTVTISNMEQFSEKHTELLFFDEKWHFFCQINEKYLSSQHQSRLQSLRQLMQISNRVPDHDLQLIMELARRVEPPK